MHPTINLPMGTFYGLQISLRMYGRHYRLSGERFDAMNEVHLERCSRRMVTRINVIKVGFWDPKNPDNPDPNEVVIPGHASFTDEPVKMIGAASVFERKSNVLWMPSKKPINSRLPLEFGFRVADSAWTLIGILDRGGRVIGLYFCHCGRDCLLPSRPNGKSVFETVAEHCAANYSEAGNTVMLITGGGIGPCCYGFPNEVVEMFNKRMDQRYGTQAKSEIFHGEALNLPNRGKQALNLHVLAKFEALRAFRNFPLVDHRFHSLCTACVGDENGDSPELAVLHSAARHPDEAKARSLAVISVDW